MVRPMSTARTMLAEPEVCFGRCSAFGIVFASHRCAAAVLGAVGSCFRSRRRRAELEKDVGRVRAVDKIWDPTMFDMKLRAQTICPFWVFAFLFCFLASLVKSAYTLRFNF